MGSELSILKKLIEKADSYHVGGQIWAIRGELEQDNKTIRLEYYFFLPINDFKNIKIATFLDKYKDEMLDKGLELFYEYSMNYPFIKDYNEIATKLFADHPGNWDYLDSNELFWGFTRFLEQHKLILINKHNSESNILEKKLLEIKNIITDNHEEPRKIFFNIFDIKSIKI